jgi:hypothetical protein
MARVRNRSGFFARLAAVALVVGLLAAWTIAALANTGASVDIPGTGCTVYAEVTWDTSQTPPAHSEGDVQCGTPEPDPTALLREIS